MRRQEQEDLLSAGRSSPTGGALPFLESHGETHLLVIVMPLPCARLEVSEALFPAWGSSPSFSLSSLVKKMDKQTNSVSVCLSPHMSALSRVWRRGSIE